MNMDKQDAHRHLQRVRDDMSWIRQNPISNPSEVLHRLTTSISFLADLCYGLLEDQYPDEVEDDLEPWLQRLLEEHQEVWERYDKLCEFRVSERLMELGPDDRMDLKLQEKAMRDYLEILEDRLIRHLGKAEFNRHTTRKI